jgi:hypothetical protein
VRMSVIVEKILVLALSAFISLAAIGIVVQQVLPLLSDLYQRYIEGKALPSKDPANVREPI